MGGGQGDWWCGEGVVEKRCDWVEEKGKGEGAGRGRRWLREGHIVCTYCTYVQYVVLMCVLACVCCDVTHRTLP